MKVHDFASVARHVPTAGHEGEGIPIGPDGGDFPVKVRCVITSGEAQAMGGAGRTFVERDASRRQGIRDRLTEAGFRLDEAGAPLGPWVQWQDAEADAIVFVQWQKERGDDEARHD